MVKTFIGLGSNLGNRKRNILGALKLLNSIPEIDIQKNSSIIETSPCGYKKQPEFLNCVLQADTTLKPKKLLTALKKIENKLGRKTTFKWGPRIIDLDILFYGNIRLKTKKLTIPHPEIKNRPFILKSLKEL